VVRAHHADADNANSQSAVAVHFLSFTHHPKSPLSHSEPTPLGFRSMTNANMRPGPTRNPNTN
jgi:hypothetical protein